MDQKYETIRLNDGDFKSYIDSESEDLKEISGHLPEITKGKTIGDYLEKTINLLELTPNEYSIVEFMRKKDDTFTNKAELINEFSDPRIPFHTFKSQLDDTLEKLGQKGIIYIDKGNIRFTHKIFKELPITKINKTVLKQKSRLYQKL